MNNFSWKGLSKIPLPIPANKSEQMHRRKKEPLLHLICGHTAATAKPRKAGASSQAARPS